MKTHAKDGKSSNSLAVDSPDADHSHVSDPAGHDYHHIANLAYTLWEKRGCPSGSADQDWAEAERQLRQDNETPQDYRILKEQQGSVQR